MPHSLGLCFSQQFNVTFWLSLERKVSQTPLNRLKNEVYTLRGHWWMFTRIVNTASSAQGTWMRLKKHTEESNAQHECQEYTSWAISRLKILCPFESKDLGCFVCLYMCIYGEREYVHVCVFMCVQNIFNIFIQRYVPIYPMHMEGRGQLCLPFVHFFVVFWDKAFHWH